MKNIKLILPKNDVLIGTALFALRNVRPRKHARVPASLIARVVLIRARARFYYVYVKPRNFRNSVGAVDNIYTITRAVRIRTGRGTRKCMFRVYTYGTIRPPTAVYNYGTTFSRAFVFENGYRRPAACVPADGKICVERSWDRKDERPDWWSVGVRFGAWCCSTNRRTRAVFARQVIQVVGGRHGRKFENVRWNENDGETSEDGHDAPSRKV